MLLSLSPRDLIAEGGTTMKVSFDDARRALGNLYHTDKGNRYICPVCHDKVVTLDRGRSQDWVAKCWHNCDQKTLATKIYEMAGGSNTTAPAPAVPTVDNGDEGHKLVPYSLAAYAKDKVDIPADWLVGNFELKDTAYWKVPCVAIPWPDGSTTQFRFGDGHKRFKARTSPGLYVPAYQKEYVTAEEIEYCFITEGASNTHTLTWATSHPTVGAPSKSWQEAFVWNDAFDGCTTIYAIQDPPPKDPTQEDTGRTFVQKIANSFADKTVYAVRFWEPDGKGYYTGPKDANELWLSTAHLGDSTKTDARHVAFNEAVLAAVTRAEIVAPEKTAEWGKPGALDDVLEPVPPLRLDYLPQCLRALVQDVSERLSCPADLVAATCVTAVAGAVGGRAHVYPKANDKTWIVPLNLWGAMVANPSQKKSPIYNAMLEPMIAVQTGWSKENEKALSVWKFNTHNGEDNEDGIPKPARKMVHTGDATIEALQDLMLENPQGLFYTRDELSGWLADLEKKGHESDRKFFLTMWQGGRYPVNRVGRGDVYAYILCSLFGSFQPKTLKEFLSIGTDDGLFQRLQVLVWPDPVRPLRVDRTPNQAAIDTFKHVITLLLSLPNHALRFDFDPAAQAVFDGWFDAHTAKVETETYGPKIQHLTKYHSLMPLLAALFQLADKVSNTTAPATPQQADAVFGPQDPYGDDMPKQLDHNQLIDVAHAQQAVAFCTYLAGHLDRVYGTVPQPWQYAVEQLAQKLQNGKLGAEFTTHDLLRNEWAGLRDKPTVSKALALLAAKDWIHPVTQPPASGRGGDRRSNKWLVNPAVLAD